jgi:hypothetical protein
MLPRKRGLPAAGRADQDNEGEFWDRKLHSTIKR